LTARPLTQRLPWSRHHGRPIPAAGHVAVDDMDSGTVVELRVLQTIGQIHLAVGTRRVVEQLGQRAQHVIVVVESLVVVSRRPPVAATNTVWGSFTMISQRSVLIPCLPS
jgi:hypothetical protein